MSFSVKKSYVLPTEYFYVLYVFQIKNKGGFPYTTLTDWFFLTQESVHCAVRNGL